MKILLTVILSLVLVVPIFFGCSATQVATAPISGDYKCLAELHPKAAKEADIPKLGGTFETEGDKFRLIGEAKHLTGNKWSLFFDHTLYGEPLDNKCDSVVTAVLIGDKFFISSPYSLEIGLRMLGKYCEENKIDINDFIHKAKPLKLPEGST